MYELGLIPNYIDYEKAIKTSGGLPEAHSLVKSSVKTRKVTCRTFNGKLGTLGLKTFVVSTGRQKKVSRTVLACGFVALAL